MNTTILYQGHASFRLTTSTGVCVYIDPFAGEGYDIPANLILATHQHHDHNQVDLPPHAADCVVYQNMDALQDGRYQTVTIHGVRIEAVQAYNEKHQPETGVGYLVTVDGHLLYFAGDTSRTAQMTELAKRQIEYAFLPADGFYNMDLDEAMECARIIKAHHTVPIHLAPGRLFDEEKAAHFRVPGSLILRPGRQLIL